MSDAYVNEGDLLIQSPFTIAYQPTYFKVHRWGYFYYFERAAWIDDWRVVDARPGVMFWPVIGPRRSKNVR